MIDPWQEPGEWLRCALHAHTTNSDGELAPQLLAQHYARAGYDVLAITDHWVRTDAEPVGNLLVIPSVELNCILPDPIGGARDGHVLGFGISCEPAELAALGAEYADLARTADWIEEHGGVAYLAHPYWTGAIPGRLELPPNVVGIEVFNAGCELEVGRGLASVHWDELLEAGRLCAAIATDDSHHPGFDSDHAWTWVRSVERSAPAVLDALSSGSFYSSNGPLRKVDRRRRQRRSARLPSRRLDPRDRRRRARHGSTTHDSACCPARACRGRRRLRPQGLGEPVLRLNRSLGGAGSAARAVRARAAT